MAGVMVRHIVTLDGDGYGDAPNDTFVVDGRMGCGVPAALHSWVFGKPSGDGSGGVQTAYQYPGNAHAHEEWDYDYRA